MVTRTAYDTESATPQTLRKAQQVLRKTQQAQAHCTRWPALKHCGNWINVLNNKCWCNVLHDLRTCTLEMANADWIHSTMGANGITISNGHTSTRTTENERATLTHISIITPVARMIRKMSIADTTLSTAKTNPHYGHRCRARLRCPLSRWHSCASLQAHCCGCCCCWGCCVCEVCGSCCCVAWQVQHYVQSVFTALFVLFLPCSHVFLLHFSLSVSLAGLWASSTLSSSRACSAALLATRQVRRRSRAVRMCGLLSTRIHQAFLHHVMCLFDTSFSSCVEFTSFLASTHSFYVVISSSPSCPFWASTSLSCFKAFLLLCHLFFFS